MRRRRNRRRRVRVVRSFFTSSFALDVQELSVRLLRVLTHL
jgi:hypothetical protein